MSESHAAPYILGLDLGSNSIGWACLKIDRNSANASPADAELSGVLLADDGFPALGSHIFEEGVENYGQGDKEESRNKARRMKRGMRRNLLRRARRMKRTFAVLASAGLLPPLPEGTPLKGPESEAARDAVLKQLDTELFRKLRAAGHDPRQLERLPYLLRAEALSRALDPCELGRAIYHLAQRRGFQSNRKGGRKDDDAGAVKGGIKKLNDDMTATGARTLGEFLLRQVGPNLPLRERWTSRDMYKHEFTAIWAKQVEARPELANVTVKYPMQKRISGHGKRAKFEYWKKDMPLGDAIRRALFHQRPLRSQRHLRGKCELEPGQPRCPEGFLEAQQFKVLCDVNNLRVREGKHDRERPLHGHERAKLLSLLTTNKQLTWAEAKKQLDLPRAAKFSREESGEKHLKGNRTYAAMFGIFGDRWQRLVIEAASDPAAAADIEAIVHDLHSIVSPEAMRRRVENWQTQVGKKPNPWARLRPRLTSDGERESEPELVADNVTLGDDFVSYSRKALRKLIPVLEHGVLDADGVIHLPESGPSDVSTEGRDLQWVDVTNAVEHVYKIRPKTSADPMDFLPPVRDEKHGIGDLRNPLVMRVLTELRHVVNGVIERFGKPYGIRIELARDIKKNKADRQEIIKKQRDNEKARSEARASIQADKSLGINDAKRADILRFQLWRECNHICPYTLRTIGLNELYGGSVDIEHIIPYSRSQDDGFLNKTLCDADFNRKVKANKTPWETFQTDPEAFKKRLEHLQKCVDKFGMPKAKLERFRMTTEDVEEMAESFRERQLNDTKYATRMAMQYLARLYGGDLKQGVDANGYKRIQPTTGQVTAKVRDILDLNSILNDGAAAADRPGDQIKEDGRKVKKSRDDHRHHAVDALVTALTGPAIVKRISDAARLAEARGDKNRMGSPKLRDHVTPPWGDRESFLADVRGAVFAAAVSHRSKVRLRGALHAETNYSSRTYDANGKPDPNGKYSHIRKGIATITPADLESKGKNPPAVVDENVRAALKEWFDKGGAIKADDPSSYPHIERKRPDGSVESVPIRKVRIRKSNSTFTVGAGDRLRRVETSANHHMAVFEVTDKRGNTKWVGDVVSLYEAAERLRKQRQAREIRRGELLGQGATKADAARRSLEYARQAFPIVVKSHPDYPDARFLMTLQPGDLLEIDDEKQDGRKIVKIASIWLEGGTKARLRHEPILDARLAAVIKSDGLAPQPFLSGLFDQSAVKVTITPAGRTVYLDASEGVQPCSPA